MAAREGKKIFSARGKDMPLARARFVIYLFNYLFKESAQLSSQEMKLENL